MIEKIKQQILDNKREALAFVGVIILVATFIMFNSQSVASSKEDVFKSEKPQKVEEESKPEKNIYVDIQGEVARPGFYRIKNDARVFDLLQLAGGLKTTADRKNVNQAKKLSDQEQIYIPKVGEIPDKLSASTSDSDSESTQQVNINAASVDELQNLPGVGPKKAEKIVQYREENGNFEKIDDLTKVSGFGEKSLESLKEQITV